MGIIARIQNKYMDWLLGVKHNDIAEYVIGKAHGQSKYWKNCNDFDKVDFVKVPCSGRIEAKNFINIPTKNLNLLDLVCNPAVKEVSFSMASLFPSSKPTVCFVGCSAGYVVSAGELSKSEVKIYELGRVFIKLTPNGLEDRNMVANIGEARYVIVEDDKSVQALPVIVASNPDLSKSMAEKFFTVAMKFYMAIQYNLKYRPEVLSEGSVIRRKGSRNEKPDKPEKPERVVKVKKVIKKEEAPVPESPVIEKASGNTINCPAWGVSGHFRHLKDGRVIWIKPYVKGKERNNPAAYSKKTYEIINKEGM